MAQICVDNAQIRDGNQMRPVPALQRAPRPEADSSAEEEEEAARLGEQGL